MRFKQTETARENLSEIRKGGADTHEIATINHQQLSGTQSAKIDFGLILRFRDEHTEIETYGINSGHINARNMSAGGFVCVKSWPDNKMASSP